MAKAEGSSGPETSTTKKGKRYATNKLVKKRRAERSLPRVKKSLKNRIRDLRRQIMKQEKGGDESKVAALREEMASLSREDDEGARLRKKAEKEKRLASRYHKVKFFERRKLERKLGALRRQENVQDQIAQVLEDLRYVKYYPKDKKYLSLFGGNDADDAKTNARRQRMRLIALQAAKDAGDDHDDHMADDQNDDFFVDADDTNDDNKNDT